MSADDDVLRFQHSTVTLERGPVGTIGRIDYHNKPARKYVGPLADETIQVLREVSQ